MVFWDWLSERAVLYGRGMSLTQDQIDAELASRAEGGFTEEFTNGGHTVKSTPLRDLWMVRNDLRREAQAEQGGGGRLVDFDPNL